MNPLMMIGQMIKNGGNPQQIFQQMMWNNPDLNNNPIMKNAFEMAQKGDFKGVEELARNLCKEKGINPDEAIEKVRQQLGM